MLFPTAGSRPRSRPPGRRGPDHRPDRHPGHRPDPPSGSTPRLTKSRAPSTLARAREGRRRWSQHANHHVPPRTRKAQARVLGFGMGRINKTGTNEKHPCLHLITNKQRCDIIGGCGGARPSEAPCNAYGKLNTEYRISKIEYRI